MHGLRAQEAFAADCWSEMTDQLSNRLRAWRKLSIRIALTLSILWHGVTFVLDSHLSQIVDKSMGYWLIYSRFFDISHTYAYESFLHCLKKDKVFTDLLIYWSWLTVNSLLTMYSLQSKAWPQMKIFWGNFPEKFLGLSFFKSRPNHKPTDEPSRGETGKGV